jgi:hypothetical protein
MARFTVILPSGSVLLRNEETGETLRLSAESGPLRLGTLEMSIELSPAPDSAARQNVRESAPEEAGAAPEAPHPAAVSEMPAAAGETPAAAEETPAEAEAEPAAAEAAPAQDASAPESGEASDPDAPLEPKKGDDEPLTRPPEGPEGLRFAKLYDEPVPPRMPDVLPPGFGPNEGEPFLSPSESLMPGDAPQGGREPIRVLDAPLEALTADDFDRTLESLSAKRNEIEGEIQYLEEIEAEQGEIDELTEEIRKLDEDFSRVLERRQIFENQPSAEGKTP